MMEQAANYSFDIRQENGGYRYTVKPTSYGLNLGIKLGLFVGFFLSFPIIGFADMHGATGFGVFLWLIFTGGMTYGIIWLVNNVIRRPSEFLIANDRIEINGKSYDRKHVTSLFIKHPREGVQKYGNGGGSFVIAGTSVGGVIASNLMASGMQLNREISASFYKSVNKYRYMLYFGYGEKKVKLAGGMPERGAELLFDKVVANHS